MLLVDRTDCNIREGSYREQLLWERGHISYCCWILDLQETDRLKERDHHSSGSWSIGAVSSEVIKWVHPLTFVLV